MYSLRVDPAKAAPRHVKRRLVDLVAVLIAVAILFASVVTASAEGISLGSRFACADRGRADHRESILVAGFDPGEASLSAGDAERLRDDVGRRLLAEYGSDKLRLLDPEKQIRVNGAISDARDRHAFAERIGRTLAAVDFVIFVTRPRRGVDGMTYRLEAWSADGSCGGPLGEDYTFAPRDVTPSDFVNFKAFLENFIEAGLRDVPSTRRVVICRPHLATRGDHLCNDPLRRALTNVVSDVVHRPGRLPNGEPPDLVPADRETDCGEENEPELVLSYVPDERTKSLTASLQWRIGSRILRSSTARLLDLPEGCDASVPTRSLQEALKASVRASPAFEMQPTREHYRVGDDFRLAIDLAEPSFLHCLAVGPDDTGTVYWPLPDFPDRRLPKGRSIYPETFGISRLQIELPQTDLIVCFARREPLPRESERRWTDASCRDRSGRWVSRDLSRSDVEALVTATLSEPGILEASTFVRVDANGETTPISRAPPECADPQ